MFNATKNAAMKRALDRQKVDANVFGLEQGSTERKSSKDAPEEEPTAAGHAGPRKSLAPRKSRRALSLSLS